MMETKVVCRTRGNRDCILLTFVSTHDSPLLRRVVWHPKAFPNCDQVSTSSGSVSMFVPFVLPTRCLRVVPGDNTMCYFLFAQEGMKFSLKLCALVNQHLPWSSIPAHDIFKKCPSYVNRSFRRKRYEFYPFGAMFNAH